MLAGLYLFFGQSSDYLAEALVRLEKANISGVCLKPEVADAICEKILATEKIKLRSLKLRRTKDFPASPSLLNQVKAKIKLKFVEIGNAV